MNNIAAVIQATVRIDYLRKLLELVENWPQTAIFDCGVVWAAPTGGYALAPRFGSLMGLAGLQEWACREGLKTTYGTIVSGDDVRSQLRQPAYFNDRFWKAPYDLYRLEYRAGAVTYINRAAIAAFLGIGEWDAGRTFQLYGSDRTTPQREQVSHRLRSLIRQHGG